MRSNESIKNYERASSIKGKQVRAATSIQPSVTNLAAVPSLLQPVKAANRNHSSKICMNMDKDHVVRVMKGFLL